MEKESILNQIIAKNQLQDWVNLNVLTIVDQLFNHLNDREKDVLIRRFGLHGQKRETLEGIGRQHSLTRERIRQIESGSIKKIKKNNDLAGTVGKLRQAIVQLLESHGGFMSQEHLFEALRELSKTEADQKTFDNYLRFLTSKILHDEVEKINSSSYFNNLLKLKYQSLTHLEQAAEELLGAIRNKKALLSTQELIDSFKTLNKFKENQDKFSVEADSKLSYSLADDIKPHDRAVYATIKAMTDVEQNKFGYWGHKTWREINPKTINDKIYLVLKYNGKPMYYGDIAKRIAELAFDSKKVNTATTHNELILDDKYILVGRGLYGLKEWGYKQGTVADVVADILKETGQALTKQEITEKVLEQRLVKQTTINLALMNKDRFQKIAGNKYQLKQD